MKEGALMPSNERKDRKTELIKLLESALTEASENNLSMYFVKKPNSEKTQAFQPQISTNHAFDQRTDFLQRPKALRLCGLEGGQLINHDGIKVPAVIFHQPCRVLTVDDVQECLISAAYRVITSSAAIRHAQAERRAGGAGADAVQPGNG